MTAAEKARFDTLEEFGFGPNVMKKTAVCAKCGQTVSAGASTCPQCGGKLSGESLYDLYKKQHVCCPECDTVLFPGSRYCPNCGKHVPAFVAGHPTGRERP